VKLATIEDPAGLALWLTVARANYPAPVELHALAQGWELRCSEMRPYRIDHDDDREVRRLNEGTGLRFPRGPR
jgi:hypothetical protein